MQFNTPGVFIEEIATLPASVVQVPTAIPAFIGVTATKPADLQGFRKIGSLVEYESAFGQESCQNTYLYSSIKLFYANGGGDAYICSVFSAPAEGSGPPQPATQSLTAKVFTDALDMLKKESEPTLILFPDAVALTADDLGAVQKAALSLCQILGNRFCILDVPTANSLLDAQAIAAFRKNVGPDNLDYGAAYGPWLQLPPTSTEAVESAGPIQVPASGAIAGIYAAVDSQRGVWKAPANVSISGIIGVTETINDNDQASLNVDETGGKSINVIRAFPDRGILIWGARTLDGISNEWRYVPVRRLFIMVEESIRRSTAYVVFEPNDANTWIKAKAMVENFLCDLWRQGALAGSKPEQAFFVNVGLGTTMTSQDILDGRLIINVGMAAVRPAEFVIIRFAHLLQVA